MTGSFQYAYLIGTSVFLALWAALYLLRKDLRREMLTMSVLIGVLSVMTAYYWWTVDWWRPGTITNTKVGVEDFLVGFGSGGIMAVAYSIVFKKRLYRARTSNVNTPSAFTLLLLLGLFTSWLFWGVGLTSFWASSITMGVVAAVLFYCRRDLIVNGIFSGVLISAISLLSYFVILSFSPDWVSHTYQFETLSGSLFLGIPVEEFVFWFLTGAVFGPFYEYWHGQRLGNIGVRKYAL